MDSWMRVTFSVVLVRVLRVCVCVRVCQCHKQKIVDKLAKSSNIWFKDKLIRMLTYSIDMLLLLIYVNVCTYSN